jgi:hypothetical protein
MLERVSDYDWRNQNKVTLDLCAGYGQFTVRMIRIEEFDLMGEKFDVKEILFNTYIIFSELQLSSCYKLLHIYSPNDQLVHRRFQRAEIFTRSLVLGYTTLTKSGLNAQSKLKEIFGKPLKKYSLKAERQEFVAEMEKLTGESEQTTVF